VAEGEESEEEVAGELEATLSWMAETTMPGWTMLGRGREGGRNVDGTGKG